MSKGILQSVQIGPYTFEEVADHGFPSWADQILWRVRIVGKKSPQFYSTLDHALVSAVGERWTGTRGAGGTGVGTAADWFMKMIGADVSREEYITRAADDWQVIETAKDANRSPEAVAEAVVDALGLGYPEAS